MPWFRVDDTFYSSRKVLRIPRARRASAIGLWLLAGTWCAHELTDGRIDHHELGELGGRKADADALVAAGLWRSIPTGYTFHDWHDYQPTRASVLEMRAKEAERKRSSRQRPEVVRADSGRTNPGVRADKTRSPENVRAESGHPVPSRPDPTLTDRTTTDPSLTKVDASHPDFDPSDITLHRARNANISDLRKVWTLLTDVCGPMTADGCVELVEEVSKRSKEPVKSADAYIRAVCKTDAADVLWDYERLDLGAAS